MSKKPAKIDRRVNLPDWADDVTPADEVMRKFYAPTGTFKSGPIGSSKLDSQPTLAEASRDPDADHESLQGYVPDGNTLERNSSTETENAASSPSEYQQSASAILAPTSVTEPREDSVNSVLPSSAPTSLSIFKAAVAIQPESSHQLEFSSETQRVSTSNSFTVYDDFARKWKMYLYPGQLAVMRILYGLTHAVGENDCFTRYSEIADATKMSRRNCINVVNSLVNRGFVERLEVRNDASAKGIRLRIHLEPTT